MICLGCQNGDPNWAKTHTREKNVCKAYIPATKATNVDSSAEVMSGAGFAVANSSLFSKAKAASANQPRVKTVFNDDPAADEDGEAAPGAVGAASSFGAGEGADGISAAGGNSMQDALAGGGSSDMLASFALELAFPAIRPMIEDQVRRATVTVIWNEGSDERSFDVTQYIVAQQGSGNAIGAMGGGTTPVGNTPAGNNTQGTSQ